MFKSARWRSEKNKIRAVFKLQFQATQVPNLGWETMMVTLVPMDAGRPTSRSEKAAVIDGECRWTNPIYETVKLARDLKTGKIGDKVYQFLVSATGSTAKPGVVGEIAVNLADHVEGFKPSIVSLPLNASSNGAIILHVTVQRMQGDGEGRVADESGDVTMKRQRKTLQSQLSINDDAEGHGEVHNGINNISSVEQDYSFINNQAQGKFPSSRNIPLRADSDGNLTKSSSFDAISASGSDASSGQFTPKEIGIKNNNSIDTRQKAMNSSTDSVRSNADWFTGSAPDGSTGGSTSSSGETGLSEALQEPDAALEQPGSDDVPLRRQLEVSELELQTLRKQVVKENRRGQDLSRELSNLKEERDALMRECKELKGSRKRTIDDEYVRNKLQLDGKGPWSMLEEARQELDHEKNLNANLRLQLQKTQESNSELILAVRELEELLDQKNGDVIESTRELSETASGDEEQYDLALLIKDHGDVKVACSLEQKIVDLNSMVELYRKDREDIETQMEQIALDYEILKQENHDISSKLEQTQLREQLRMQYECSAHLAIINDLETYVESLENEIQNQADAFEADLTTITNAKVGEEQRAIQAEEALKKARMNNASAAERLQEELKVLAMQMSSAFYANEKLVTEALAESSELRLQKSRVEELLEKTNKELASVKGQYQVKLQQLLCLIDFRTKEADRLLLELKDKRTEIENQKKSEVTRQRASSEEMILLKSEIGKLSRENKHLSQQIEHKENLVAEMEQMKTLAKESELLLQERNLERDKLQVELASMREEANKTLEELNELRHMKDEKDKMIRNLNSEVETRRQRYSELKHTLSVDESDRENLRQQVLHLKGDLQEKEDMVTSYEEKLEGINEALNNSDGLHDKIQLLEGEIKLKDAAVEELRNSFLQKEKDHRSKIEEIERSMKRFSRDNPDLCKGIVHKGNLFNGKHDDMPEEKDIAPNTEQLSSANLQEECDVDKNIVNTNTSDVRNIGDYLLQTRMDDKACINIGANAEKEEGTLVSCSCDQLKISEILSEMGLLKERNQSMEAELKEMQERYSDMSLKFAEVEGERQQLVINIRTLKNALRN